MNPAEWFQNTQQYLREVAVEYRKISWPPQREAMAGTVGVIVIVTIITVALGVVDFGLAEIMKKVLE
jgi:preprotein translocase subunit SecE